MIVLRRYQFDPDYRANFYYKKLLDKITKKKRGNTFVTSVTYVVGFRQDLNVIPYTLRNPVALYYTNPGISSARTKQSFFTKKCNLVFNSWFFWNIISQLRILRELSQTIKKELLHLTHIFGSFRFNNAKVFLSIK
jgi:hypothetical protein